ncbi:MAG: GNAT family N-acetyltransferase, partial [Candidatus Nanoarchaeia archaeon]
MALEINLEKITKDNLHRILPELIRLENNWVGIGDAPWAPENFERELPKKWEMSRYASVFGTIVGYNIASIDGNVGRLNKIVVASDFRNKGIGDMLWKEFLEDCRRNKVERAEFKVLPDNESAISFYKKRGCLFYGDAIGTDKKIRHTVMYPFRLKERVPHSKPTISSDDKEAVIRAIEHGDLATGRMVNYFIDAFTEYIGKEFGVATNSGSAALHLALRALDVKSGDEVILPSYVCNAVLNAVSYCNANPVLVDINPDDYNISLEDAVAKKSDKTKAIILPHMFGKPIKNLDDFLKSFEGTPIIEDCALSVGASYNGKKVGSFGRLSIFSLRATKMLAAGLGGVVLTDDKDLKKRLDDLATY